MSRQLKRALVDQERTAFTREGIAVAALGLIDTEGLEAFSTRKLGTRIGLQAMSLYHYFPNREALLNAVVDCMIAEVVLPQVHRIDWRRGAQQLARRYRAMGHRHMRAIPLLAQRCPASPVMQQFLETLRGLLLKAGLRPDSATEWLLIQRDYVLGSLIADFFASTVGSAGLAGVAGGLRDRFDFPEKNCHGKSRAATFNKGFNAILDAIERER